jgi:uncharacterized protein (TIGR00369 family)
VIAIGRRRLRRTGTIVLALRDRHRRNDEHRDRAAAGNHHDDGDQLHGGILVAVQNSGDVIREIEARFGDHPVRRFLDYNILELGADRCVMSVTFKPEFDNTTGAIHGGVLAMLADTAVAVALSTSWDGRMDFATSNLNIHFLRRATSAITATATIIKKGSRICVGSCDIHDADGKLVATAIGDFVLS